MMFQRFFLLRRKRRRSLVTRSSICALCGRAFALVKVGRSVVIKRAALVAWKAKAEALGTDKFKGISIK